MVKTFQFRELPLLSDEITYLYLRIKGINYLPGGCFSVSLIKTGLRLKIRAKFFTELADKYKGDQDWGCRWGFPFPLRATQLSPAKAATIFSSGRHDPENYSADLVRECRF